MSNSVTVTVQLDGGSGSSHSFDLGDDAAAPMPPGVSGAGSDYDDYDEDAMTADAPPPAVDGLGASAASASEAPPPDFDGGDDAPDDYDEDAADDDGDSPPPPDA